MPQLRLTGVRPPVLKISATRAIQDQAQLSLAEAKQSVDRRLLGEAVEIAMPSLDAAHALAEALSSAGITAEVDHADRLANTTASRAAD